MHPALTRRYRYRWVRLLQCGSRWHQLFLSAPGARRALCRVERALLLSAVALICFSLPVQVWFQNRRARTLKCKGAKKALWQSDGPVQDPLPQTGPVHLPPQGPPPAYPTPVKAEMEEACYYGPPAYSTIGGEYGPMYGLVQGRPLGRPISPNVRDVWSQPGGRPSSAAPAWCQSPLEMRNCPSSQMKFMYPGSAEQQLYVSCSTSHSSTPDTPDSGFWDAAVENSPPLLGQYSKLEDSWSGSGLEARGELGHQSVGGHAPLPELSLQEILGELEEDWLGGEGLDRPATENKTCSWTLPFQKESFVLF